MPGLERNELSLSAGRNPALPHFAVALALLWLAGAAIRIPLLAVPPIIPLIHDDLHMSETQVGALIGMPLIMFALAAVPGSLLIARLGVMRVAAAGLLLTAVAAAARGAASDVWTLYAATLLMGFGIADLAADACRRWCGPGRRPASGSPTRSTPTAC